MPRRHLDHWRGEVAYVLTLHQSRFPLDLDELCDARRAVTASPDIQQALRQQAEEARVSYQRWLVAEGKSFSAILIGWPPGFATPIHDHDGLWGIELVLCGTLHVDEFQLQDSAPKAVRALDLASDAAAIFTDAGYAHACSNPSPDTPALSLHIYGGPLDAYLVYPQPDDTETAVPQRKTTTTMPL